MFPAFRSIGTDEYVFEPSPLSRPDPGPRRIRECPLPRQAQFGTQTDTASTPQHSVSRYDVLQPTVQQDDLDRATAAGPSQPRPNETSRSLERAAPSLKRPADDVLRRTTQPAADAAAARGPTTAIAATAAAEPRTQQQPVFTAGNSDAAPTPAQLPLGHVIASVIENRAREVGLVVLDPSTLTLRSSQFIEPGRWVSISHRHQHRWHPLYLSCDADVHDAGRIQ